MVHASLRWYMTVASGRLRDSASTGRGERGESTIFQKNLILKENVLDIDIFLLGSITYKCGLSIPDGILYKCRTTSV